MSRAIRQLLGCALGIVGVVAPAWGLFHIVRTPQCGSDGVATYGGPCPDEMGLWIVAIVVSCTVVLPLAIGVAGSVQPGSSLLLGPVLVMTPLCAIAAVAFSLAGPSSDPDTRWVGWLFAGILGLIVLRVLWATVKRLARPDPEPAAATAAGVALPMPMPTRQQHAKAMASLADQLSQVAEAKRIAARVTADDGLTARLRRLDELRAAGAISPAEHAARRQEILDEV
ncbi:MAG TPA: SHOCT domain-containing protein [Capillimicrobium sp.]|jgi:hypothetical protein